MTKTKPFWILGAVGILAIILVPEIYFWPRATKAKDNPSAYLPEYPFHTSHTDIVQGLFETPQDVTRSPPNR